MDSQGLNMGIHVISQSPHLKDIISKLKACSAEGNIPEGDQNDVTDDTVLETVFDKTKLNNMLEELINGLTYVGWFGWWDNRLESACKLVTLLCIDGSNIQSEIFDSLISLEILPKILSSLDTSENTFLLKLLTILNKISSGNGSHRQALVSSGVTTAIASIAEKYRNQPKDVIKYQVFDTFYFQVNSYILRYSCPDLQTILGQVTKILTNLSQKIGNYCPSDEVKVEYHANADVIFIEQVIAKMTKRAVKEGGQMKWRHEDEK